MLFPCNLKRYQQKRHDDLAERGQPMCDYRHMRHMYSTPLSYNFNSGGEDKKKKTRRSDEVKKKLITN